MLMLTPPSTCATCGLGSSAAKAAAIAAKNAALMTQASEKNAHEAAKGRSGVSQYTREEKSTLVASRCGAFASSSASPCAAAE